MTNKKQKTSEEIELDWRDEQREELLRQLVAERFGTKPKNR